MKNIGSLVRITLVASVVGSLALGCSAQDDQDKPEVAFMEASQETRLAHNVAKWGTYEDTSGRHVLAYDQSEAPSLDLLVESSGENALRFTGPESEVVTLTRDGNTVGTASWAVTVAALYADAKIRPFLRPEKLESGEEAVADGAQALTELAWEQTFDRSGGLFGYKETFDAGLGCLHGNYRSYYDSYVTAGHGNCYVERWSSDDETDCRVRLHIGVSAFGWVHCRSQAYNY